MTKKDLKKALRGLKNSDEILVKDEKNVYHGVEKICYTVDSDGHTFLVINVKQLRPTSHPFLKEQSLGVRVSAALSGANPHINKYRFLLRKCKIVCLTYLNIVYYMCRELISKKEYNY